MKVKISVTLSDELLPQIDALIGLFGNRSAVIEKAIRDLLAVEAKRRRDIRDIEILSRRWDELNKEVEDVLSYQVNRF
jgi:Arc/MetJ-type ribon-helix-helix transcriptional regulator